MGQAKKELPKSRIPLWNAVETQSTLYAPREKHTVTEKRPPNNLRRVARGAPRKQRQKLGYVSLGDKWSLSYSKPSNRWAWDEYVPRSGLTRKEGIGGRGK